MEHFAPAFLKNPCFSTQLHFAIMQCTNVRNVRKATPNSIKNILEVFLKEVRCNLSAHRSAHLLIIAISSHSYIKRKQSQIIFPQFNCSETMINMVKKYLWRKIYEKNHLDPILWWFLATAQNRYYCKKLPAAE